MQRVFGAIAIFVSWLSITIGAAAGLFSSQFLGLGHLEGNLPPTAVYGVPGALVLWIFVGAAVLMVVPLGMAMVAVDPRRNARLLAVAMAMAGVALFPDDLGRAFGLPLLGGAACLWIGGELIHRDAVATGSATGSARSGAGSPERSFGVDVAGDAPAPPIPAADPGQLGPSPTAADSSVSPRVTAPPPQQAPQRKTGRGRRGSSQRSAVPERVCSWCSTTVGPNAEFCPNCGATLAVPAADEIAIPGLTEVPPALRRYAESARSGKKRTSLLGLVFSSAPPASDANPPPPSDEAALKPPSPMLKAEMARLDAEIAAGVVSLGVGSPQAAESAEPAASAEPAVPPQPPAGPRGRG